MSEESTAQLGALDEPTADEIVYTRNLALDRPIPRVTIHAFASTPETTAVLNSVTNDRRFAKAHVSVLEGGIKVAAQHYTQVPTPNLILVEDLSVGAEIVQNLHALAEVCDPGTKVIVIGRENDVAFYRDLMRRGINEYLVGPLSTVQVMEAISAIYIDPSAPPVGRVFAFVAARGGAGSSTVAHNIAWCVSEEMKEEATIVDFDLPFGTAGLDFNQETSQGVADALATPERLDETLLERLLVKCTDHLSLFMSPGTLDRDLELDPSACDRVVEVLRQSVPCVIMDLPHLWAPWARHLLYSADEIVITATPDLASLRNAKNIIDLAKAARPNDTPPRLVLNQVGVAKRPEIPAKDFAEAIGLEPALVLNFEPQLFGTAANNGQMIPELAQHSRVADGFRNLAHLLTGREVIQVKTSPLTAMLEQLKAKFGNR
jgi:pilus assembly protein CpaE